MKRRDVKISVIIPVYNAEKYIHRCLDSVVNQSFSVFEIIIIDDGSTDDSFRIVEEYAFHNSTIRVFKQTNKRAAAARNYGLRQCRGTHIAFVDADDYIHPDYFSVLVDNMIESDAQVSICGFYESSKDSFDYSIIKKSSVIVKSGLDIMYDCCANNKTVVVSPWCKLYEIGLFEGIKYPEGRTYEDLATTHKVLIRADRIVITDQKLYCYYRTPQSVVHGKYSKLNFDSENMAQDERLAFFKDLNMPDLEKRNIIAVERNRITNYCRGVLYLNDKASTDRLREKFIDTYNEELLLNDIDIADRLIFKGFILAPRIYVHIAYRLYWLINHFMRIMK